MRLLALVVGALACAHASSALGLLAIDYGTEWIKASLVKPGVPFDVLLNTDSKRKIQSVVSLRGEDRLIGGDAANLAARFPDAVHPGLKFLLGHSASDAQSLQYQSIYRTASQPSAAPLTERVAYGSFVSHGEQRQPSSKVEFAEEYLAMQFGHVKKLAKEAGGGEEVRDVVVTVPVFFTHAERLAVLDAIEMAGLKPLALLDDGSAVAVNYAMTRTFSSTPEHHLFYDAGAGSIRSTVVSFQSLSVPDPANSKATRNVTSATVLGVGYDRGVGGLYFDAKIRDLLEAQFVEKEGSRLEVPLEKNRRAQAKLLKEAGRVKQVLSANAEASSRIEGLAEDIDFRGLVKRSEFEAACPSATPSFSQPIADSLAAANLSAAALDSVILVGGVSRVPMVQSAVRAFVGEEKIAQNLNADEAAVMGAALYGAGISKTFRTKEIRLQGLTPYDVEVAYESDAGEKRSITSTLFRKMGKAGVKKTMTLKKSTDFTLNFGYKALPDAQAGLPIVDFSITGIDAAFANLTAEEQLNTTVRVSVQLSESGIITVPSAQLVLPEGPKDGEGLKDKIKGLFGGKDKTESESDEKTEDGEAGDIEEAVKEAKKKAKGPINLKVEMIYKGITPLTKEEKKEASKRLREIDLAESRKLAREEARNGLEAFIYRLRDQVESDSAFVAASTESERVKIRKQVEEANEWMYDQGETAPTKDLKSARSDLEKLALPINTRISEEKTRGAAVTEYQMALMNAHLFLGTAKRQLENDTAADEPSKYTATELSTLESAIQSGEQWLSELSKKQEGLQKHEDPVLRTAELERRRREMSTQVQVLQAKRPPRRAPKKTATAAAPEESVTEQASTTTLPGQQESATASPKSADEQHYRSASSTIPAQAQESAHARDEL